MMVKPYVLGKIDVPQTVRIADGVWAQAVTRRELPAHLDALLAAIRVTRQSFPRVRGTRAACTAEQHTDEHWLSGTFNGMDLTLTVCVFCWRVEVRNRSFDILLDSAPDGRMLSLTPEGMARRKSDVLGWYSGRRPAGRIYYGGI